MALLVRIRQHRMWFALEASTDVWQWVTEPLLGRVKTTYPPEREMTSLIQTTSVSLNVQLCQMDTFAQGPAK